jgi:predicted acetyltransferase
MTAMSAAAIAPRQPTISAADRAHPRFAEYQRYSSSMSVQLVEADSFRDWLRQTETQARHDEIALHPRYPEFVRWMVQNQGGARRCPAGNSFPYNFQFWLDGGRW